ncbi:enoyl-CoA hydratase/isomerase family protein [Chloroflexota bacterium]
MYQNVLVEKKRRVAVLTFNRPKVMNAINLGLIQDVSRALEELDADDEVRVVIMTGAGRAFSTGHDMAASDAEITELINFREGKLLSFSKPLIAAVHGYVLGYGLQLALTCDIIIASANTVLGITGPLVGTLEPGSILLLPGMVGRHKASELLLTCERIDAAEALSIGLLNKVVPHEQLMPAAWTMAEKITRMSPRSIEYTRRALRWGLFEGERNDYVREGLSLLFASEDYQEAVRAFKKKREPDFKGK